MNQNSIPLDFAECPNGHQTPIRPTMLYRVTDDREWSTEDVPFEFVACGECKRVYKFATEKLKVRSDPLGLAPLDYEAPIYAFRAQISCDEPDCETPLSVIAVRKSGTTAEELEREKAEWTWESLTCPSGHAIPDRPPMKK